MNKLCLKLTAYQLERLIAGLPENGNGVVLLGRCGQRAGRHQSIFTLFDISETVGLNEPAADEKILRHIIEVPGRRPKGLVPIVLTVAAQKSENSFRPPQPKAHPFLSGALDASTSRFYVNLIANGKTQPVGRYVVVGDELIVDDADENKDEDEFDLRQRQAFGQRTNRILRGLHVGVVGCSGTGSWVIEQLMRLGVLRLTLVDPDIVKRKNLNRIVNSRRQDAVVGLPKVEIFSRAIHEAELPVQVETFATDLDNRGAVLALAECDVLFGCMDSAKGREDLARLAAFYCQPVIDVGTLVDPDGKGGVRGINGHVHYLIPGELGLTAFGIYTDLQVRSEALRKADPQAHADQVRDGYLPGIAEDSPAVISLNGLVASHGVNELLFRLHPCRSDPNRDWRAIGVAITEMACFQQKLNSDQGSVYLRKNVGRGDCHPLLENPLLG